MTRGAPFAWWASPEQRAWHAIHAKRTAAPATGAPLQRRPFSKPNTAPQPGAESAQIIPFAGNNARRDSSK